MDLKIGALPAPAGYAALSEQYSLDVIPNWHRSSIAAGTRRIETKGGIVEETYALTYWPGSSVGEHLEFALKYDGTNLAILAAIFENAVSDEIVAFIRSKPTGKYARRIWFLYEFLTGKRLPLDDLIQGNYIDAIETREYYASKQTRHVPRQRINNNLLGHAQFCPMVRRTDELRNFEASKLNDRCKEVLAAHSPEQLRRAMSYLYTKETKSSFEIEHIRPSSTRVERFIALLETAQREDFCVKRQLIALQNQIAEPRFQEDDYRTVQNYVGESVGWRHEKVHYVCPKPTDIAELMDGLITAHQRMHEGGLSAVVHAAVIGYGFVFLHPFQDGNGRIHRFLIHNILARRHFTPHGIMFPISAAMLNRPDQYDASLEAFSRPLTKLIDYTLDENGQMTVSNDTVKWYRYIDLTVQAQALFRFIDHTIATELVDELAFLAKYDSAKRSIQEVVDMPDRLIDLFIRFVHQNGGHISKSKRDSTFSFLNDEEMTRLEEAVRTAYEMSRG